MTRPPTSGFTVRHRKIILKQFTVGCEIGIHASEQDKTQRVAIDIELELEPIAGTGSDDIDHTVDYDFLREDIYKLIADTKFNLQERLCEEIVTICLTKPGVNAVIVRSCKLDVYPDCDGICYEISAAK
ncbi:MAG: dihydroneopterin aldolase [Alphaproteobacteria bacterium]|jgi:dihydroneopterin aldolase